MFYLNQVKDILLLKAELEKKKALYARLLKESAEKTALNEVRRVIKSLLGKINALEYEAESAG